MPVHAYFGYLHGPVCICVDRLQRWRQRKPRADPCRTDADSQSGLDRDADARANCDRLTNCDGDADSERNIVRCNRRG